MWACFLEEVAPLRAEMEVGYYFYGRYFLADFIFLLISVKYGCEQARKKSLR